MTNNANNRAIVSYLNGVFWLRYNEQQVRIPPEHTTSKEKLSEWVERQVGDYEVAYNFPGNLLKESESV
jgi:hypothetical protein